MEKKRPFVKALLDYVLSKSETDKKFHSTLQALLGPVGLQSSNHVAFVFSERLVNMPVEIMAPMYRMLGEEIQWAVDDVSHGGVFMSMRVSLAEIRLSLERTIPVHTLPVPSPNISPDG